MIGGGFIQQMVKTIRENKAFLASQNRKKENKYKQRRSVKTKLKFPKINKEQLAEVKKKHTQRSMTTWIVIYTSFVIFFGTMIFWIIFL